MPKKVVIIGIKLESTLTATYNMSKSSPLILDNADVNLAGVMSLSTTSFSPVPVFVVIFTAKTLEAP